MNSERILQARKAKSLSQQEVASATGISQEYLSRLERGERLNLSLEKLGRLLAILELTPNDLIGLPTTQIVTVIETAA